MESKVFKEYDPGIDVYTENAEYTYDCENESEYTLDLFRCSICHKETNNIDIYVSHMTVVEQCVLVLCPSSSFTDVFLPRFLKKSTDIKNDMKTEDWNSETVIPEEDVIEPLVSKIETGEKKRWKCKLCYLTFSREAAFHNHFKLTHEDSMDVEVVYDSLNLEERTTILMKKEVVNNEVSEIDNSNIKDSTNYEENLINKENEDSDSNVKEASKQIVVKKEFFEEQKLKKRNKDKNSDIKDSMKIKDSIDTDNTCPKCEQIFKNNKIMKAHLSVVHSNSYPFSCDFSGCGQSFKTKGSFVRHQRRHTGERPFTCTDCGRVFRESGSLARHRKSRILCRTKTDQQLPRYGMSVPIGKPAIDQKPYISKLEEEREDDLKSQVSSPDEDEEEEEEQVENKASIMAQIMRNRVKVKQEDTLQNTGDKFTKERKMMLKNVRCKIEPNIDDDIQITDDHISKKIKYETNVIEENEDQKPEILPETLRKSFICPICREIFKKQSLLNYHLNRHLDELDHKCNQCDKKFTSNQALIRHLISHSNIRQYECCICEKTFKLSSHAKIHLLTHSDNKNYNCGVCGKAFKSISSRNVHEKIHSGEKSFSCTHCSRSFGTKGSLNRHLLTHTGETPFKCPHCGYGFKEHGTLKRHLNNKMPCSQQAKLKEEGHIPKEDRELFLSPESSLQSEADIPSGSLSPSLTALSDVNSTLFSSSISVCSKQSFIDSDTEEYYDDNDPEIGTDIIEDIHRDEINDNLSSMSDKLVSFQQISTSNEISNNCTISYRLPQLINGIDEQSSNDVDSDGNLIFNNEVPQKSNLDPIYSGVTSSLVEQFPNISIDQPSQDIPTNIVDNQNLVMNNQPDYQPIEYKDTQQTRINENENKEDLISMKKLQCRKSIFKKPSILKSKKSTSYNTPISSNNYISQSRFNISESSDLPPNSLSTDKIVLSLEKSNSLSILEESENSSVVLEESNLLSVAIALSETGDPLTSELSSIDMLSSNNDITRHPNNLNEENSLALDDESTIIVQDFEQQVILNDGAYYMFKPV